ncbi:MAG TPA: ATP-binding protein [Bauldia sp.]|nr:ATP-binding protein [Bauldia sp.]
MTGRTLSLRLPNRLAAIARTAEEVARFCRDRHVPEATVGHINLALDEAITNTIEYAWPDGGEHEIALSLALGDDEIVAELSDDGIAFDPLKVPPPDLDADLESRPIGGLGVHFVKTLMDDVAYRRENGRNVLTMRKRFVPEGARP